MCGFCGILSFGNAPVRTDQGLIDRMTDSMAHRGPNDRGTWIEDNIALGHRRLSVIDLSDAGRQPMENEDGSVVLVFNGEIYNFRELRAKHNLDAKGHVFRSRTDSEVLIHLYEELGADMVAELNGMFGFAIWDKKKKQVLLARDPFGVKPLFYMRDQNAFRFASEIKGIITDPSVRRSVSLQALHDFLTLGYIPGDQTAFQGIQEIPPGHMMTVATDGQAELRRFWDLDYSADRSLSETDAIDRSLELMEQALERQLVADVPVGVFLSGGLDSSTLLALMSRQSNEQVRSYSIGFQDQSFNELPFARRVSDHFQSDHHEVIVTPDMVRSMLPRYLSYIDEPYADGSAIPTYFISEKAKDDVVVVLSGEGGDEIFAGYETHSAYNIYKKARRVPGFIRNDIMARLAAFLPVSDKKLSFEFKLKRFLAGLDLEPHEAHMWWRTVLTEAQKWELYSDKVRSDFQPELSVRHFEHAFSRKEDAETLSRLLYIDSTVFLPDDLMIKNDRMTMAHSLEARVPFTDPDLTAFLATVPASMKMKNGRKKHLMRGAMNDILPTEILNKKKVGLEMPYSRWLKSDLKDVLTTYLDRDRLEATGLFRPSAIQSLIDDHMQNRKDNGRPLWSLINFMMWHELYIDA